MPSSSRASSPVEVPEYNTQFEPREDDSQTLWSVLEIIKEDKQRYLVKWEGIDPKTGKPWDLSWVPKRDCTDDLIHEWKTTKVRKAQSRKKKRSSKGDPDYNPKGPRKSEKSTSSGGNSRSNTASFHKPSSAAGPSRLRLDNTAVKVSPVVEITTLKKRPRESRRSDAESTPEIEEEGAAAPRKKKRKLVTANMVLPSPPEIDLRSKVRKPQSRDAPRGVAVYEDHYNPPPQPPRRSSSLSSPQQRNNRSPQHPRDEEEAEAEAEAEAEKEEEEEEEEEEDGAPPLRNRKRNPATAEKSPSLGPQYPSQDRYKIDSRSKFGKRRVVASSQESAASDDLPPNNDERAPHGDDDDPVERTSRDDGPHQDEDPSQSVMRDDDGEMDAYMGDDGLPMVVDDYPPPEHDPDADSSRSPSPPDPRSLLYSMGTETIIPETQPSPSSSQLQPPKRSTPAKPASPQPQVPERADKDHRRVTVADRPTASKAPKPKPLHPIPAMPPSIFNPYLSSMGPAPPDSQMSSIGAFTSPSKSQAQPKGTGKARESPGPAPRRRKVPAYSQRQEEEESESESDSEDDIDQEPVRSAKQQTVQDVIEEDRRTRVLDEALRLNGERLSLEAHVRSQSQKGPKPAKRPLSKVFSQRSGSASDDPQSDMDREVSPKVDAVQHDMSREVSTSADDTHPKPSSQRGVMKSVSKIGRSISAAGPWLTGRSSAEDPGPSAKQIPGLAEAVIEEEDDGDGEDQSDRPARENDQDRRVTVEDDHAPDAPSLADAEGVEEDEAEPDELGPDDAPDARGHASTPRPRHLPLLGEVNYSLEATGPSTQNSYFVNPSIDSPTKQLNSALGLLHRKSDEIHYLSEALEVQQARAAKLEGELARLRGRLEVAERRYGEVSAELDMEKEVTRGVEEGKGNAPVASSADTDRLAELLQENERLKAANARLQSDTDMLRGLYAQASDAHQTRFEENRELTRHNLSLQAQATTGVKQAGIFWQTQVRTLETELTRSRGAVKILTDQARQTGDEVRKRAALLPMAQAETEDAREEVEEWKDKLRELGRENTRLRIEVKGWEDEAMVRRKREREIERKEEEGAVEEELVWMCPWMDAEHRTKCAALLESREKLREHFYEAGHI